MLKLIVIHRIEFDKTEFHFLRHRGLANQFYKLSLSRNRHTIYRFRFNVGLFLYSCDAMPVMVVSIEHKQGYLCVGRTTVRVGAASFHLDLGPPGMVVVVVLVVEQQQRRARRRM